MSILKQGRLFISRSFDTENGEGCVFVSEVIKESNRKKEKRHRDKRGVHFVEAIIEKKSEKKLFLSSTWCMEHNK